jgi:prevent-host-death family protein
MLSMNILRAKAHLSQLINAALQGQEVVICKAGKPVVRLVPLARSERDDAILREIPELTIRIKGDPNAPLTPADWGDLA